MNKNVKFEHSLSVSEFVMQSLIYWYILYITVQVLLFFLTQHSTHENKNTIGSIGRILSFIRIYGFCKLLITLLYNILPHSFNLYSKVLHKPLIVQFVTLKFNTIIPSFLNI